MKAPVVVTLFVLLGTLAFAPAPLPKPSRRGDANEISVATFQGNWRVAGMMSSSKDGRHRPYTWQITHVRVEGQKWTFLRGNGNADAGYIITIDNSPRPAHLDFWNGEPKQGGRPSGGGIIRRKGDVVEIIYVFGGNQRPVSFEEPPDGQYLLTLQQQGR